MNNFKLFLFNEERTVLGKQVGNVLTGVQELNNDLENMGTRHISRCSEEIVNRIRKIIHGNWKPDQEGYLKDLQRIAVAIQKTVSEKGDIKSMLPLAMNELEKISSRLGVKVNDLTAPEEIVPQMPVSTEADPSLEIDQPSNLE